jgi:hypothetical protein
LHEMRIGFAMTSSPLLRPVRTEAEARAAWKARTEADPHWLWRWMRRRNPMPGVPNAKLLAVHVSNAGPKSALE